MTNFDLFAKIQDFASFTEPAVSAERIYQIDTAACVLNCRRAMEAAVKWMYSVDRALVMPYQDNLVSLIGTDEFRNIVDESLLRRMDFIRKTGNAAAHAGRKITREQAALCLENLFIFLDFVAMRMIIRKGPSTPPCWSGKPLPPRRSSIRKRNGSWKSSCRRMRRCGRN